MENLSNFISALCLSQHKFVPKCDFFSKTVTSDTPTQATIKNIKDPSAEFILNWKKQYHLPDECVEKLEVVENSRIHSLYTSILYLLSSKYITLYTFDQKNEFIEEFIRLLISKMETDVTVKTRVRETTIKPDTLIDEIKNEQYQSSNVIFYVSVILDINIICLSQQNEKSQVEIYSSDDLFDTCKPCIILFRTAQDVYYPIKYNGASILIYYEHDIIQILSKYDKTITINFSSYIKRKYK